MLHQAEIETRRNLVLAAGDPAGIIVSTGGVPAGSVPAGSAEIQICVAKAFEDPDWVASMQEEMQQFYNQQYVKDMLKKFGMESVRTATTPYEVLKPKSKDEPHDAINVHLYRYMIGSLMYLIASRPDIMFAVSACSRHQVTPMASHLKAVQKIFKYLYSDSDYAGSYGDRKSTTGGCQFLGRRLISWQCKKQIVVVTSSTEAEYVAVASCCGQSTICIVKNPVFHQRTKHIEIRHHFIRDANEKNLIQMLKIHTDENVADFLTKAFDGPRFHYLVYVYILTHSCRFYLVYCKMTAVSYGFLLYAVQIVDMPPMLLVVPVFLLVVLVHADGWVSAGGCTIPIGSCTIPTGSYSFMLLDWFLLDDHNKVAYLEKGKGWEAYEQILDFLNRSHIQYALTHRPPIVFDSLVKQFWATATVRTLEAGPSEIIATIDGNEVVVTESLIRTQLQLNDESRLYKFTLHDVLDGMREIRTYNFSRFILDGMIGNIGSKRHKILMFPRFLQMILGIQTTDPSPRPTFDFTAKLFSNMKLNWDGPHMPLLAPMLVGPSGGDGAGAAAANEVPSPSPPIDVPPTHKSSSSPGPFTATQDTPVWDPTPVREPVLVREPTPSPVREPTPFREPTPASPRPPSPLSYPRSEEVGPTTSTRPPSPTRQTSFQDDISEGGGDDVSLPKSNEAPPTTTTTAAGGAEDSAALTDFSFKLDRCINKVTTLENELGVTKKVLGGAVLKLVSRVKRLEGLLQQRKRRLVLSDSEGEEAATKEQDINLDALHKLANAGHDADEVPDDTTMPFRRTRTKRRQFRKTYTSSAFEHFQENISAVEDTIPTGDGIPADAQTTLTGSTPISAGSSMDPARQAAAAAAPSSTIPAADKGKAPMVGDSLPADFLTVQERILKNLHDYQLGEDLAKKLQAEQEAEFARQQEELAQKAQAKSVASPAEQRTGLSAQRRRELDAAQLIYAEADWFELMAKIATNSALSKQLLGDDVNEDNMNERLGMLLMRKRRELAEQSRVKHMNKTQQRDFMRDFMKNQSASVYNQGWTMKQVKALSLAQLKHEFEYIQRTLERSNLLNFKRTTFRPTPTLEAPSDKRARQGVPQDVHAASLQVPTSVPTTPSIAADVSFFTVPSIHVDTEVYADESHPDDNQTASEQVFAEHTVDESTPSSSCTCRKQIAKKRVTLIVDVADNALIKFDSASESDDDPSPYAPYADWEMVPTPLGSIHAYYDMEEHTKHFTSLHKLLHMVEKNDLRQLLGDVDKFYQRHKPDTFALILWGDLRVLFQSLSDEDAHALWCDQESWRIRSWHLYPRPYVHVLETVDGWVIYMFVDVSYPLSAATLKRMLKHGLEVPKLLVGGDLTMAEQLPRWKNDPGKLRCCSGFSERGIILVIFFSSEQSCVSQNSISCDVVDQSSGLPHTVLTEDIFTYEKESDETQLNVFDSLHNHEVEREEFKHVSNTERHLTYAEQFFIVKVAGVNIGESDAHMLISKMENRMKYVSDFSFDYLVENAELVAIFWADEFQSTTTRSSVIYKMVFVPFTAIDNYINCITVAAGLLNNETTHSYVWLLKAFINAFGKAPSIVVTDQDRAIRNANKAEFAGLKQRLCMWHITQKLPTKAQLNSLRREIKKVNKKVYTTQVGCELCKGPHYTKDCPLKEEGKTLDEAYNTQFGDYMITAVMSRRRGIAENVLVMIGKFIFSIDFIILDKPKDDDVPLILRRSFLSTTHAKIDVFKRKITLRAGEEKIVFKSIKPATSIIRRVYMLRINIDPKTELIGEDVNKSFDPQYGDYIELNDLDDEGDQEGKKLARTLIDIPIFVGTFFIISGFSIIDDMDVTSGVVLGMSFCKKFVSCQMIIEKFAHRDEYERLKEE
nr:hypothetical protein [Tanacetum cinerariifolium]